MISREMDNAANALEEIRVNSHRPPANAQAEIDFLNKFTKDLNYFGVKSRPEPAQRHNKLGVFERKNSLHHNPHAEIAAWFIVRQGNMWHWLGAHKSIIPSYIPK